MVSERQIAVFFDAENISPVHEVQIRMDLLNRGRVCIAKAYGDFHGQNLRGWVKVCKSNNIELVSRPEVSAGKNASDIAMCIDMFLWNFVGGFSKILIGDLQPISQECKIRRSKGKVEITVRSLQKT